MPLHDWTLVEAGIFHDFHTAWIGEIRSHLNSGALPEGYYALAEQHAGQFVADVLALHATPDPQDEIQPVPIETTGGTAVAEAPPKVCKHVSVDPVDPELNRSIAIRHISTHRIVALIEIISPGNKDRSEHVEEFAVKTVTAIRRGVNVLVVDLFPPGAFDSAGMHQEVFRRVNPDVEPVDEPQGLAAYVAGLPVEAYLDDATVGDSLPDMPLFLNPERYVNVPLQASYDEAYAGMPAFWRDVIEGRSPGG